MVTFKTADWMLVLQYLQKLVSFVAELIRNRSS